LLERLWSLFQQEWWLALRRELLNHFETLMASTDRYFDHARTQVNVQLQLQELIGRLVLGVPHRFQLGHYFLPLLPSRARLHCRIHQQHV
jgi:hypothetical protein